MHSSALAQLATLQTTLDLLQQGQLRASAFSESAQAQTTLLQALPPRYTEVLHDLLNRLESGALFSEESCSFSQQALLDNLQQWTEKAQAYLQTLPSQAA